MLYIFKAKVSVLLLICLKNLFLLLFVLQTYVATHPQSAVNMSRMSESCRKQLSDTRKRCYSDKTDCIL